MDGEFENVGEWYLSHEYRSEERGLIGRTYHEKGMVNGKMPVYIDDKPQPMLCDPKTLLFVNKITKEDELD